MTLMGGYTYSRFSSATLLAFAFLYSAIYFVQVHRLLPGDEATLGDPYAITGRKSPTFSTRSTLTVRPGALEALALAAGAAPRDQQQIPGLALAAGELPPLSRRIAVHSSSVTVSTWLKPRRQRAASQCLAAFGQRWALILKTNGCPAFVTRGTEGGPFEYTALLAAPIASWTHVAVAYDAVSQTVTSFLVNGSTIAFSTAKSQEWAELEPRNDTRLQLAVCSRFNGTSGGNHGQLMGWLAGTQVYDRALSKSDASALAYGAELHGPAFTLTMANGATTNATNIPKNPEQLPIVHQINPSAACAVPSPNTVIFTGVTKAPSLTAVAWIKLSDAPRQKEACIISHGSWEHGWKWSITPQLNLQFTAHTTDGDVYDFFSRHIDSHGDWQQVAVSYNGHKGSVEFYINGFPLEVEAAPQIPPGKTPHLSPDWAPLTIGRCQPDNEEDERLVGSVADVTIWNQPLDFIALRLVLHRGIPAALNVLRIREPTLTVSFATPSIGCHFNVVDSPQFPAGWKPMLEASTHNRLQSAKQLLRRMAIIMAPSDQLVAAQRTLEFIDSELGLLLKKEALKVPAVLLARRGATGGAARQFRHLNVTIMQSSTSGVDSDGDLQEVAAAAARHETNWVLIITDTLNPMEYWLWNLMAPLLSSNTPIKGTKSLTLNFAGSIKSAGLQHQYTVLGDGKVVALPYMLYRGYPASYLSKVAGQAQENLEATTCESLMIDRKELLTGASRINPDMQFLYQCAALTVPLAVSGQLKLAPNSWIVDKVPSNAPWNPNAHSMLQFHESHISSALGFHKDTNAILSERLRADLQTNLTVKWMFACGGSWAWEAANLVEHLNRKVQLRVQIQKPFAYCEGHNVLGAAAASFSEQVERMMHLPALGFSNNGHLLTEPFYQDDVVVYHRDYFRVTNWMNPAVKRARYLVGRYMNEVSTLHVRLVEQCNALDEVWVPSQHHIEIFSRAGVERQKLFVVPESIDTFFFDPGAVQPLSLPGRKKFVFLSNFKFEERKNWKTLIWAYCDAFTSSDDVSLFIHTNLQGKFDKMGVIMDTIQLYIQQEVVERTQHRNISTIPHIALTGRPLSTRDMMSLYKASDAFVLPTHGEGWGLPLHEAMAMGLPTISTNWGGNTEFMMAENSYLIQVEGFEDSDPYDDWIRNMKWSKPDKTHLSKLLREVFDNPAAAKAKGIKARLDIIKHFSNEAVANQILKRLQTIEQILKKTPSRPPPSLPLDLQFQWTIASDVKICENMKSVKRVAGARSLTASSKLTKADQNALGLTKKALGLTDRTLVDKKQPVTLKDVCKSQLPMLKVAFVTPFPPRHDGLAQYAANLRASLMSQCSGLQVDIFALVLDFWNADNEAYDPDIVKFKVCRESYSDYQLAADRINRDYDVALFNFKLGAIGGTQCAYATCFAKMLSKPLVTIFHSVTHNVEDPLQATMIHTLAESNAAVVFSERARMELDSAIGYVPSENNLLQADRIYALPHGANISPDFPNKQEKKTLLGLNGKTVLLTLGYQGPDKGTEHVIRGLGRLSNETRSSIVYLIVGRPADCGQPCVDYRRTIERLVYSLGLQKQVLIINDYLSDEAVNTVFSAADLYMAVYPEDLFPHPATFYQAMAHGCGVLATPFKAAMAHMPSDAGLLLWDRSPETVSTQLITLLSMPSDKLLAMQQSAWRASQDMGWSRAGSLFLDQVLAPLVDSL